MASESGHHPRTGQVAAEYELSTPEQVTAAVEGARAAAGSLSGSAPALRQRWLSAVADALDAHAEELVDLADAETALGRPRLTGEVARAASQLRFYASVAVEGSWLGASLDAATPTSPALARVRVPLGPVAVFGASNFPFAFGVLGNDTASALAAGCPVVAKGHPAHPGLSRRLAELATAALAAAGAPGGTFSLVTGFEAGQQLVDAAGIAAVAFTGSQAGGMALLERARSRPVPVPVFAEMGTVNPVVVTPAGARTEGVAAGFVGSFTLGSGQFCTKPGLLLVPAGSGLAAEVAGALARTSPSGWALTGPIAEQAGAGVAELVAAGAREAGRHAGPDAGYAMDAVVLEADAAAFLPGSRLLAECFGPVALVVEYDGPDELAGVVSSLQGALAASVIAGADDPDLAATLALLTPLVGRVAVGDWPTGVAWTWAQNHGGPWPATSEPGTTSVGAAALDRFTRPLTFQSVPDAVLPPALQKANPWRVPRRVDGTLVQP